MLLIIGNTLWQETLRQRLKLLTEEKSDVQSQLMDCHLRIEQEGKVWISATPVHSAQIEGFFCLLVWFYYFSDKQLYIFPADKYFSNNLPSLAKDWERFADIFV